MSFFGALLGGAFGSMIASGGHGTGRYIILKFKSSEECERIVEKFNKDNSFDLDYPNYGVTYKGDFYQEIEIMDSEGSPKLEKLFFVKENKKRIVKFAENEDGEKHE